MAGRQDDRRRASGFPCRNSLDLCDHRGMLSSTAAQVYFIMRAGKRNARNSWSSRTMKRSKVSRLAVAGSVRWATAFLLACAAILPLGPAASASCAGTPTLSPYAFQGRVEQTDDSGRLAQVMTEDGRRVLVQGGETERGVATGNDRTFVPHAKYEFHPTNESSPFHDNACTATRIIEAASDQPSDRSPRGPAVAVAGDMTNETLPIFGALTLLLVAILVYLLMRGSRSSAVERDTDQNVDDRVT